MKRTIKYFRQTALQAILITSVLILFSCNQNGQNPPVNEPSTTIHEAAFLGNTDEIVAHIKSGSDLNEKDPYGSSALYIATVFDKPEVARLLVEAGADLNATSADGSTPLHTAAFLCRKEIVKVLLENGAELTIQNAYGSTPLESVSGPFDQVKPVYEQMSKDLGPMGFKLDYNYIASTRPEIAEMIANAQ
ncbi:MAG: ankyrin repeat domain-containing protein [Cyclobacteriaceae bacterium]